MSPADVKKILTKVLAEASNIQALYRLPGQRLPGARASAVITEGQAAIEALFPPHHAVSRRLSAALNQKSSGGGTIPLDHHSVFEAAVGSLEAGLRIVDSGGITTVLEAVRVQTVSEVLDQAEALLPHAIAAAVLAGGALETHLLHLCQRNALTWQGDGSIGKYDGAIAQARNSGAVVYQAEDSKLITGWGGVRNLAAHEPTKFNYQAADIQLMVQGIRQFVARVP